VPRPRAPTPTIRAARAGLADDVSHGYAKVPWVLIVATACSRPTQNPGATDEALSSVTAEQLLAKVRGLNAKAVMVNAWATWCGSCEHELPMLQGLADTLASKGVRVLLVSVDEPDDRAYAQAFLTDNKIRLTSYLAARPLGAFKSGMNPRWAGVLPASFLFDTAGKLRYFWGGEAFENEVVPIIDGLLAGKPIDGEAHFGLAPGQTTDPR
jgi:thiol-disulfide isomerase/thioredoxin